MVSRLQSIRLERHLLQPFEVAEAENKGRYSRKKMRQKFRSTRWWCDVLVDFDFEFF